MPALSRWAVRLALLQLAAGTLLGAWLLVEKGLGRPPSWSLLPLHRELVLFGWLVLLVIGIAYWILPRLPGRPPRRGRRSAAVASVVLLEAGLVAAGSGGIAGSPTLMIAGRACEAAAALAFAVHAWPRVRAAGVPRE